MDSRKEKWHQSYTGYKTPGVQCNGHFERNNHDSRGRYGFFKSPRTQKYPLKRKNDFGCRRSNYTWKKGSGNFQVKAISSPEDAEEEERKKKLSETANKLLSKIKTWSAEKNDSSESGKESESTSRTQDVSFSEQCDATTGVLSNVRDGGAVNNENKPKRIAHSKSVPKQNVKAVCKNPKIRTCSKSEEYNVNNASVKDFQSRIQHKLINDLMQMPKENLINVLNDPKINPLMELKMSSLVKKNKLVIAQKLRAMAEAKMALNGATKTSELLMDIDKLIDPIIETDLSVFPYELIKQMENVFQVQFDYSSGKSDYESDVQTGNSSTGDRLSEKSCGLLKNEFNVRNGSDDNADKLCEETGWTVPENVKIFPEVNTPDGDVDGQTQNSVSEDLLVYECSTDEDEDLNEGRDLIKDTGKRKQGFKEIDVDDNKRQKLCESFTLTKQFAESELPSQLKSSSEDTVLEQVEEHSECERVEGRSTTGNHVVSSSVNQCTKLPDPQSQSSKEFTSTSCQANIECKTVSVQTFPVPVQPTLLYGIPLPEKPPDNSPSSLLQEVNSIQILLNKLNERRFMIFLELSKSNTGIDLSNDSFTESITNGNIYLLNLVKQCFMDVQNKPRRKNERFNEKAGKNRTTKCKRKNTGKNQIS